jgi:predicted dehydrogenase
MDADAVTGRAADVAWEPREPVAYDPSIAVVGCGGISGVHLEAYRAAGYDVTALCDVREDRAVEQREEHHPSATVYTDHETLLADADVDVVDVPVPPGPRERVVEDALLAGKHVLSQKPFATSLDAAKRLVQTAADEGVHLAVNQNGRWAPNLGYLRAAAAEGVLGRVHGAYLDRYWDYNRIAGDDVPHRLLFHYAVHAIDLVGLLFADATAERVSASLARSPDQTPEEPLLGRVAFEFDRGQATLVLDGDSRAGPTHETRVIGSDGTATSRGPGVNDQTVRLSLADGTTVRPALDGQWFVDGFRGAMAEFLAAIEDGREPPHSGRDNLRTMALVLAATESADRGEPVVPGDARTLP